MPSLADLLGVEGTLPFEGKEYKLRPPTQVEEGRFSRSLEARARAFAERAVDLTPEAQDGYRKIATKESASYQFDWGSEAYVAALGTPAGMAEMLFIVIEGANPDAGVTRELVRRIVAQKLADVLAIVEAAEAEDPAKKKQLLESVGLPANYLDSNASTSPDSSIPPSASPSTPLDG